MKKAFDCLTSYYGSRRSDFHGLRGKTDTGDCKTRGKDRRNHIVHSCACTGKGNDGYHIK